MERLPDMILQIFEVRCVVREEHLEAASGATLDETFSETLDDFEVMKVSSRFAITA